jgi:hypothetical protein
MSRLVFGVETCARQPETASRAFAVQGVTVPLDMDALLPGKMAAMLAGTSVQVIVNWRNRGYLQPADEDAKGKPLYRVRDVLAVEAATAQRCEQRAGRTPNRAPAGTSA